MSPRLLLVGDLGRLGRRRRWPLARWAALGVALGAILGALGVALGLLAWGVR